jgi:coenzyme PQQ precursor peptide PqqA
VLVNLFGNASCQVDGFGMALASFDRQPLLRHCEQSQQRFTITWRNAMQWTTPSFIDMRFGLEITMYIATR